MSFFGKFDIFLLILICLGLLIFGILLLIWFIQGKIEEKKFNERLRKEVGFGVGEFGHGKNFYFPELNLYLKNRDNKKKES